MSRVYMIDTYRYSLQVSAGAQQVSTAAAPGAPGGKTGEGPPVASPGSGRVVVPDEPTVVLGVRMKGRARMSKRCKRKRRTFSVRVARVASMLSTHVSVVIWARKGQAGLKDRDQGSSKDKIQDPPRRWC